MSEPTQSDAPATDDDDQPITEEPIQVGDTSRGSTSMVLRRAIAGVGDKDEPIEVADADLARRWHDAGYADYYDAAVKVEALTSDGEASETDMLTFRTKAEAKSFAEKHDLDVADATSDEYRAAVAQAYREKYVEV